MSSVIIFVFLVYYVFCVKSDGSITEHLISIYGDGYGTVAEWITFPSENDLSHKVNITDDAGRKVYSELEFKLYTRNNSNAEDAIIVNQPGTANITIEDFELSDLPLKVITHGWRSSSDSKAVSVIKDAYIQNQDVNVITVDWSHTANSIFYHWVASQSKIIGTGIATFLNSFTERFNITGDQLHLIGHSLGAHIMGIAAYHSNLTVDRITGLDPARPLFEYPCRDDTEKLDSSDADFVDVIHTCGGILGIEGPIGTADFFPNSGIPPQPGCDSLPRILEACSHSRSYYYFAESIINPKAFPTYQCKTWREYLLKRCQQYGYMGDIVTRNNTGNYYLQTNPTQPYGREINND